MLLVLVGMGPRHYRRVRGFGSRLGAGMPIVDSTHTPQRSEYPMTHDPRPVRTTATCPECGRVFDLADPTDAEELAYGHDCEA